MPLALSLSKGELTGIPRTRFQPSLKDCRQPPDRITIAGFSRPDAAAQLSDRTSFAMLGFDPSLPHHAHPVGSSGGVTHKERYASLRDRIYCSS